MPFKHELEEHGMSQSMSRVGRCIDNGPMEGWQGLIKEMREVLYPNANSYEEMEKPLKQVLNTILIMILRSASMARAQVRLEKKLRIIQKI